MEKPKQEKRRKRKKRLLTAIREQIEFYFSDANLRHDKFMRELVGADDEELMGQNAVDLNEFLKFNKISQITQRVLDIRSALESSNCLSLDKNDLKVKRIEPFVNKDKNFSDESTIYVERLPPNADHNWIRSAFGGFGRIEYIKIPHFKHNNNIMGFAFIEFSESQEADKAVKHFNRFSAEHKNGDQEIETKSDDIKSEPKNDSPIDDSSQPEGRAVNENSRKRLAEVKNEEVIDSKKLKISQSEGSDKDIESKDNDETNNSSKKKKKRKRKRKPIVTDVQEEDSEVINLRVMSKTEWKRWKKEYLKLQKQSMASIKKSLLVERDNRIEGEVQNEEKIVSIDKSFESGLIIKLNFTVPSSDLNENDFKRNIRQIGGKHDIQYIDLPMNRIQFKDNLTVEGVCYIRTNSCEDCQRLVSNERLKQLGNSVVLEGIEETEYWNQIFEQRIKKKSNTDNSNKRSKNKVKGFDKIINRVENVRTSVGNKLNKHIKFNENQ